MKSKEVLKLIEITDHFITNIKKIGIRASAKRFGEPL